jgi:hypothetical protein
VTHAEAAPEPLAKRPAARYWQLFEVWGAKTVGTGEIEEVFDAGPAAD